MHAVEANAEALERVGQDRTRNEAREPESMNVASMLPASIYYARRPVAYVIVRGLARRARRPSPPSSKYVWRRPQTVSKAVIFQ